MIQAVKTIPTGYTEEAKAALRKELEDALTGSDRVVIFHVKHQPNDVTLMSCLHWSSQSCMVAWMEFLGLLQHRLIKWHEEAS